MDFFDHQDQARRQTGWLLLYFGLAVILIILTTYLAAVVILLGAGIKAGAPGAVTLWSPERFVPIAGLVLIVVTAGSLYKTWSLSSGGEAVARMLGGSPVDPNTADPALRRLLNVVEEMALASGTPVPPVFVLEDPSINAFAAGFAPSDAVIGVTRGTVKFLTRDELQGVLAHEFSHVVNGDMRLNLRLTGVLHGILVLALIGYALLRGGRTSRKGGGGVLLFGAALVAIGYLGVYFGRLIKSAVSRQREHLADAAAVQFTRNPMGLAGALKKIGGLLSGSRIESPAAEQVSHMFFADSLKTSRLRVELHSTHPPLIERIRRLDPAFDGRFPDVIPPVEEARGVQSSPPLTARTVAAGTLAASAGMAAFAHVDEARKLLSSLPALLVDLAHEPEGARAMVLALLVSRESETRRKQLETVSQTSAELAQEVGQAFHLMDSVPREARLVLLDLSLPALRRFSTQQARQLLSLSELLIAADARLDLFELVLKILLTRRLDPGAVPAPPVQFHSLVALNFQVSHLLSCLAHAGHDDPHVARSAFDSGAQLLHQSAKGRVRFLAEGECDFTKLPGDLNRLRQVSPAVKRTLIAAAEASVSHDGKVDDSEAELFRAIAEGLDVPVPVVAAEAG